MTEPVYFVVTRRGDVESPALVYDQLPAELTRKIPRGSTEKPLLVYALRLDTLPNAAEHVGKSLNELWAMYLLLRKKGTLPPSNIAPPPAPSSGAGTTRKFGEWWEPPAKTWDDTKPYDPTARAEPPPVVSRGIYLGLVD